MEYQLIQSEDLIFEALGMTPDQRPDVSKCREKDRHPLMCLYLMELAIEAINPPGYIADLSDFSQRKTYLWPDIVKDESKPSGLGFSNDGWADSLTSTGVGSRRAFADVARGRHFWKYFQYLFEGYSIAVKH